MIRALQFVGNGIIGTGVFCKLVKTMAEVKSRNSLSECESYYANITILFRSGLFDYPCSKRPILSFIQMIFDTHQHFLRLVCENGNALWEGDLKTIS